MTSTPQPYRTLIGDDATSSTSVRRAVLELDEATPGYVTEMANLRIWLPLHGRTEVQPARRQQPYPFAGTRIAMLPPDSLWAGGWNGSMTCMVLEVAPSILHECSSEPILYPDGGAMLVAEDERIRHTMLALHQTLTAPGVADELFTQHVARAVALHYLQHYCGAPLAGMNDRHGLTRRQMERLGEFIESRLTDKITLDDLAQVVGMNAAAFCRRFKRTVGVPPYQYVLRTRVERAKRQLRQHGRSLSEIALSLGFYDQSQFTNTFRRIVGLSPRAYRQRLNS